MTKYVCKTCWKCKHRIFRCIKSFDGKEYGMYICMQRKDNRGNRLDVSGRHWKCEMFEKKGGLNA